MSETEKDESKNSNSTDENVRKTDELRVKNVAEINEIRETVNCATESGANSNGKRKVPDWMVNTNDNKKKPKSSDEINKAQSNGAIKGSLNNEENHIDVETKTVPITTTIVKEEPVTDDDNEATTSTGKINNNKIIKSVKVEKADATSSTSSRESCKFGIRCYRQNAMHRLEEAHPGDSDYKRPSYPRPPDGTPDCPYGNSCYRRNPAHFQQYSHPSDTDFEQNYRKYRLRQKRQRQPQNNTNIGSDDSEQDYDLDDPFINDDSDEDYIPSDDDIDDTEELDYDECDKVEE